MAITTHFLILKKCQIILEQTGKLKSVRESIVTNLETKETFIISYLSGLFFAILFVIKHGPTIYVKKKKVGEYRYKWDKV